MADDALGEIDEGSRHGKRRSGRLRRARDGEQVGGGSPDLPDDASRRHAAPGEVARRIAPAVEIVGCVRVTR